jgi:hypothetical protein
MAARNGTLAVLVVSLGLMGCLDGGGFGGGGPGTGQGGQDGDEDEESEPEPLVPTNANRLYDFLLARRYAVYPHDAQLRRPTGPHGIGAIRVYYKSELVGSIQAGAEQHPVNAAAVAELYDASATSIVGFAVSVKTASESDAGQGWYWYELLDVSNSQAVSAEGVGIGACTGCHVQGVDFVLSAG